MSSEINSKSQKPRNLYISTGIYSKMAFKSGNKPEILVIFSAKSPKWSESGFNTALAGWKEKENGGYSNPPSD